MDLFPLTVLSNTEQELIAEKLNDPEIKKYFKALADNIAADLLNVSVDLSEPDEQWYRKELVLRSQLNLLKVLYSIKPVAKPNQ